ncbi:MAG: hypothetical protein E7042_07885 [Lentisphaerae bacterium]|nr:hypothetical protein [Lentisphaerota bacterium]
MAFRFICPYCNTETEIDDALKGTKQECPECCETVVLEPSTEKKCPHCAEVIKINAKICRFCHKSVNSRKYRLSDLKTGLMTATTKTVEGVNTLKKVIMEKYKTPGNSEGVDTSKIDADDIVKIDPASVFTDDNNTIPLEASDSPENNTHFEFECPICHNILEIESEYCGMETECPICNTQIIIPTPQTPQKDLGKTKKRNKIIVASIIFIFAIIASATGYFCYQQSPKILNVTVNVRMKNIIPRQYLDFSKVVQTRQTSKASGAFRYNIYIYDITNTNDKLTTPIHTEKNVAYDYDMKDGVDIKVSLPEGNRKIFVTMQLTDEFRQLMKSQSPMSRSDVFVASDGYSEPYIYTEGQQIAFVCSVFHRL